MNYIELFDALENNAELHPTTSKVEAAEKEVSAILEKIEDNKTMLELDYSIGVLIRAYEKQGFLFGLNCSKIGAGAN